MRIEGFHVGEIWRIHTNWPTARLCRMKITGIFSERNTIRAYFRVYDFLLKRYRTASSGSISSSNIKSRSAIDLFTYES